MEVKANYFYRQIQRKVCKYYNRSIACRFRNILLSLFLLLLFYTAAAGGDLRVHATRVLRRAYDGLLSLGRTVIGYPPTFRVNASFIFIRTSDNLMSVCTLKLRNTSEIISFIDIMAYFIPIFRQT